MPAGGGALPTRPVDSESRPLHGCQSLHFLAIVLSQQQACQIIERASPGDLSRPLLHGLQCGAMKGLCRQPGAPAAPHVPQGALEVRRDEVRLASR
jgi:hypothetical protein